MLRRVRGWEPVHEATVTIPNPLTSPPPSTFGRAALNRPPPPPAHAPSLANENPPRPGTHHRPRKALHNDNNPIPLPLQPPPPSRALVDDPHLPFNALQLPSVAPQAPKPKMWTCVECTTAAECLGKKVSGGQSPPLKTLRPPGG